MTIAQEEIFGPVLATLSFDDIDQVAELANKNIYGLAAGIWTNDIKKAHALSRRLKAGTVWINTYGPMDAAMPFGGYKQSRLRARAGRTRHRALHRVEDRLARICKHLRRSGLGVTDTWRFQT